MRKSCLLFLLICLMAHGFSFGDVLLDDTWTDASRVETNLPTESAVWISHPDGVTMGVGSLAFDQTVSSSQKMWTYFAAEDSPVTVGVGEQLVASARFTPRVAMYDVDSTNFRFGLFYDPTDPQVQEDMNSDSGDGAWTDSTGYATRFSLSTGPLNLNDPEIGKRIDMTNTSLLGSSGAYEWYHGGADTIAQLDTEYTVSLMLDRTAADVMDVTFTLADAGGEISTYSWADTSGIYTDFEHLFFRFSSYEATADVLDFHELKVELIPEPATMLLLGLGGLMVRRRKR